MTVKSFCQILTNFWKISSSLPGKAKFRFESLKTDENDNIQVTGTLKSGDNTVILNKRITGKYGNLDKVKQDLLDSKKFNSNFLSEQILDENSDESTAWLMIAFDLGSTDDPQSWLEKLYLVHACMQLRGNTYVEKHWFGYLIVLIHKLRIMCSLAEFREPLKDAYTDMNTLSRQLYDENSTFQNQQEAWKFHSNRA